MRKTKLKVMAKETAAIPPNAGAEQAKALADANETLFRWLSPPTAVFLQGCIGALNHIRPEFVLYGICEVMGRILGHMYAGQPEAVQNFRAACITNFSNALTNAEIRPLPQKSNDPNANPPA